MSEKERPPNFIATFENGGYWEYYKDLERQFENFLEQVPYLKGNVKTYSFRLVNLILTIGAHIDSAFKEMARYPESLTKYPLILTKRNGKPKKNTRIGDYYDLAIEYKLAQRKVMFKRVPQQEQLMPFQQYAKVGNRVETPNWWRIYNGVKHHFSENFEKANLKTVRDALAGAFLLNVIHHPAADRLAESGLLKPKYAPRGFELIYDKFRFKTMQPEKCSPSYTQDPFTIETALFIYDYEEPKDPARAVVEEYERKGT